MDKKKIEIKTPKQNTAYVTYSYDGIPTDGLIPLYLGYTIGNKVTIQPHLVDDVGLLRHELTHVDQSKEHWFFSTRYKYNKNFRFEMESEAFAAQLHGDKGLAKIEKYANELSNRYNINKTKEQCITKIKKYYKEQSNG